MIIAFYSICMFVGVKKKYIFCSYVIRKVVLPLCVPSHFIEPNKPAKRMRNIWWENDSSLTTPRNYLSSKVNLLKLITNIKYSIDNARAIG